MLVNGIKTYPYFTKNISKNKEQQLKRVHRQFDGIRGITILLYDEELDNSSYSFEETKRYNDLCIQKLINNKFLLISISVTKKGTSIKIKIDIPTTLQKR